MKKTLVTGFMALTCLISAKMYVPENATAEEMQQAIETERRLQQGGIAATRTATPVYKNTGIVSLEQR